MRPVDRPEANSLLGKINDYLFGFGKLEDADYQLIWCQGEGIGVCSHPKMLNTVSVRWDQMQNSDRYKYYHEADVDLLQTY